MRRLLTAAAAPLLASAGVSATGDGMLYIAAPLLASDLTRNALTISAVTAAVSVTWLLAGLPAGVIVNRTRGLRRLLAAVDAARAVLFAGVTILVILGYASILLLIAAVAADTAGQCLFAPGVQAMIPAIVGTEKQALHEVNGRFWALTRAGSSFAGPPAGSITFAIARPLPFLADAISYAASAILIRRLPQIPPHAAQPARKAIRQGLRYIASTRNLTVLLTASAAQNAAISMVLAVFVLYAREFLAVRPGVYGLLFVPGAVLGLIASWRAGSLLRALAARQAMTIAGAAQPGAWVLVATAGQTWAAVTALVVVQVAGSLLAVAVAPAYQSVPAELRGRVASASRVVSWGSAGVGAIAAGVIADQAGLRAVFPASAALAAAGALAAWPWRQPPAGAHGEAEMPSQLHHRGVAR